MTPVTVLQQKSRVLLFTVDFWRSTEKAVGGCVVTPVTVSQHKSRDYLFMVDFWRSTHKAVEVVVTRDGVAA